jgi:hypothetical protein
VCLEERKAKRKEKKRENREEKRGEEREYERNCAKRESLFKFVGFLSYKYV